MLRVFMLDGLRLSEVTDAEGQWRDVASLTLHDYTIELDERRSHVAWRRYQRGDDILIRLTGSVTIRATHPDHGAETVDLDPGVYRLDIVSSA